MTCRSYVLKIKTIPVCCGKPHVRAIQQNKCQHFKKYTDDHDVKTKNRRTDDATHFDNRLLQVNM